MKRLLFLLLLFPVALYGQTKNATVTLTVTAAPAIAATNNTPVASPTSGTYATVFTLTGSVTGSNNGASPTGKISVFNGTTLMTSTTLDSSGNYSCRVSNLPPGTVVLTMVYSGDANFLPGVNP